MDAKKWRENRENLVSNWESRWSVLVEGRATPGRALRCKRNDALLIHYTIWKRSAKLREDTFTRSVQQREDALIPNRSPEKKRKDA